MENKSGKGTETHLVNLDTVTTVIGTENKARLFYVYDDGWGDFDESYAEIRELIASAQGEIPMGRAGNGE